MKKAIFVTGTDTGAGKTVITGLLARFLLDRGCKVVTQKWIETGCIGFSKDIKMHLKIMNKDKSYIKDYLSSISSYAFKFPASPHLAAQKEGRKINSGKIKKDFRLLSNAFDFVIVEGTGGALVPFNSRQAVIDIVKDLDLPILLVSANRLGAINHTLLTLEALYARKMNVLGVMFNNFLQQNQEILTDNQRIIKSIANAEVFGALDWNTNYNKLYKDFVGVGEKIWKKISG